MSLFHFSLHFIVLFMIMIHESGCDFAYALILIEITIPCKNPWQSNICYIGWRADIFTVQHLGYAPQNKVWLTGRKKNWSELSHYCKWRQEWLLLSPLSPSQTNEEGNIFQRFPCHPTDAPQAALQRAPSLTPLCDRQCAHYAALLRRLGGKFCWVWAVLSLAPAASGPKLIHLWTDRFGLAQEAEELDPPRITNLLEELSWNVFESFYPEMKTKNIFWCVTCTLCTCSFCKRFFVPFD